MKSWRVYDINDMRLEDVPVPEIKPGWLLAQIIAVQPSITEIQRFLGTSQNGLAEMKELIQTIGPFPLGHEICGVVRAVGDNGDLKEGDRIAHFPYGRQVAGSNFPGCFAEYALLPVDSVVKIDPAIPDIEGPALQPLSSCVEVVREANVQIDKTVAVFGQGVMGINITQLCRLAGAKRIIGVDVRDQCLGIAGELGADVTINASKQDPVPAIMEYTDGKGADIVFECASGDPDAGLSGGKSFFNAVGAVCQAGCLAQVAFFHDSVTVDLNTLHAKHIKYMFPDVATREDMELGIQLVAGGKVRIKPCITHVLDGIDRVPEAFEITANKEKHGAINPAVVRISE